MKRFLVVLLLILVCASAQAQVKKVGNGRLSGLYTVSVGTASVVIAAVTNASWTALPLTEVVRDQDSTISGASFTVPISGWWMNNCRTKMTQTATADAKFAENYLRMWVNGVQVFLDDSLIYSNGVSTSGDQGLRRTDVVHLDKGDVVSYSVWQSGSSTDATIVVNGMSASFVLLRED